MIQNLSEYYFLIFFPSPKNYFQKEKREKRKQESSGPLKDAECYKSRRAAVAHSRYAHAAYGGHYLGCPFNPFRMKI